jgi:hypothetical protein
MTTGVKIVPDATPNADGHWIEVPVTPPETATWSQGAALLEPYIPSGYHIVRFTAGYQALWVSPRDAAQWTRNG